MSKVLVLYYSSYGHIEAMAHAVAEGARQAGAQVDIKRVPELVPEEIARQSHYKLDQAAPIAKVDDLAAYDAIAIGAGTRFGRLLSQMANFLDQAGGLWARGALHGKVGGAFTSTATQHGGQETTLFSIITNLLHFGMVVVGLGMVRRERSSSVTKWRRILLICTETTRIRDKITSDAMNCPADRQYPDAQRALSLMAG
jgi:NAD(P)H dehydrogenase (quinone)